MRDYRMTRTHTFTCEPRSLPRSPRSALASRPCRVSRVGDNRGSYPAARPQRNRCDAPPPPRLLPQKARHRRSAGVGHEVPRVTGGLSEEPGGYQLGRDAPGHQREGDVAPPRHAVIVPPTQSALQPEPQRQASRNQQNVGDVPIPQWRDTRSWNQPAIDEVRRARRNTERIAPVKKTPVAQLHSKAAVARPKPSARSVLRKNRMLTT